MKTLSKVQQISFIIQREFVAISTSYAILLVLIGGIFVYGLLYNYMYAPNIVTDVPVAVVDNSHSQLSRNFIRWLDATPQTEIYDQAVDYHEAKEWMKTGKVQGIIYLPHDFEDRVFRGDEAVFSLYATTDAFLYFEALQGSSSLVMLAINDKYRPDGAVFLPPQGLLAIAMAKPVNVSGTALYNYTEGYGSYLIPAVMMIIIFQTLLMVIGMATGEEYHTGGIRAYTPFGQGWGVALRIVAGKTFVYCSLYAVFSFFLLGLLPYFFSIPNIGNGLYIVLLLIPYLIATSFLGLAASRYFTDSEAPLLMIAFFSVGLIFLSGVSYPLELMPWYWKAAHYILPAAPATLAFVKLNSMGASMADIRPEYITLWIQAGIYFLLSIWVYKQKLNK
ncbi:ABC transporter permease [Bacteroides sp.]|uniref:ABC transporter permease n=1 Tax=Bacteroides sp. TaxID=29523 RepID=UPI0026162C28|nr:ABC transporter permease [Bacteroides sp.]MDD3037667.1 ABC transporter permease [Bacteroides sp.]